VHICGNVCRALKEIPQGVTLQGFVKRLSVEYSEAELAIVPLTVGSGLKIRMMEAWEHGLPVVSTSVGLQGVREIAQAYNAAKLADTVEEYANAVVQVLVNDEYRLAMRNGVDRLVREKFSADVCYGPMAEAIRQQLKQ
jgi:succinoglycan biosynthesis protein ExoO